MDEPSTEHRDAVWLRMMLNAHPDDVRRVPWFEYRLATLYDWLADRKRARGG